MSLPQGQYLNERYWIANLVEQGGFGSVYKAWDVLLNRPCALKESYETSPEGQRQFLREAQILANLTHPNLPRVTDYFTIPEQGQYLVMDFVEGKSLEELRLLAGEWMAEAQALGWMDQVLDALSYIHRQNPPVIHRDIKPTNIKVTPPDENYPQGRAMLVDFGVAKTYEAHKRTTMGARAVTPGFSPIEQYGMGATDARTDIYALGATLYTLLTGQEPPEAPQRVLRDPLAPPRQLNPDLSAEIEAVILKAMHMDPEERFQTAGELKAAIRGLLGVASSQQPGAGSQPVGVRSQPPEASSSPPAVVERLTQPVVEEVKLRLPQAVAQPAAAVSPAGQVQGRAGQRPATGSGLPAGVGGRGALPPSPPVGGVPSRSASRSSPWKWLRLAAGLVVGLGLVVVLVILALKNISRDPQAETDISLLPAGGSETMTESPGLPATFTTTPDMSYTAVAQTVSALLTESSAATLSPTPASVDATHTPSPLPALPTETPSGLFEYTVQEGDTLGAIVSQFNTDIMALLALNPTIDPVSQSLNVGQRILIPAPGASMDTYTSPVDGMVLSYIPAGTFQMGEDADRSLAECQLLYEPFTDNTCLRDWFTDEEPVHTVTLDAFWMDQTEVTNGMYALCVAARVCSPPYDTRSYTHDSYYEETAYADYPVIYVDWSQAADYCAWAGRALPTEAQWEYAARGGLVGKLYPWGDMFDGSLANFCDANCSFDWSNPSFDDGYADTAPVGSYPANGYGLHDMSGNVAEWVAEWYDAYSSMAVDNPSGPDSGSAKLLRGGSWYLIGYSLRVSDRGRYSPVYWYRDIGFRCARSP